MAETLPTFTKMDLVDWEYYLDRMVEVEILLVRFPSEMSSPWAHVKPINNKPEDPEPEDLEPEEIPF